MKRITTEKRIKNTILSKIIENKICIYKRKEIEDLWSFSQCSKFLSDNKEDVMDVF